MKVVYLSCYRDGTGYAKAAIENILAMDAVGLEVVPRSVKMTDTYGDVPSRVLELEKGNLDGVDVVIQHNLPNEFAYKGGVQNIGAFAYETSGFPNTSWRHDLSMMDKVVVFCNHQKSVVEMETGHKKVFVVPHAVDLDKFKWSYEPIDFGIMDNVTKFYCIAEWGRRKNLAAVLAAYFSEFDSDDNVILIIKTHSSNRNPAQCFSMVKDLADDLRKKMGRFSTPDRYAKVILITEYMTDEQINALHQSCDVFVTASHGEAFCLPAFDALGFGNRAIVPLNTVFYDFPSTVAFRVPCVTSPVLGVDGAPHGLYTADERWSNVSITELASTMRFCTKHEDTPNERQHRKDFVSASCSREVVGNIWKEVLNAK